MGSQCVDTTRDTDMETGSEKIGTMIGTEDAKEKIKSVKKEASVCDSFSEDDSDYTYTDCSDSEETSSDSGFSISITKDTKKQVSKELVDKDDPYSSLPLPDFSEDEQKTAEYLAGWKKAVTNPKTDIVKELQEKYADEIPGCDLQTETDKPIANFIGEKDEDGNMHGEIEINYENGD